MRRGFWFFRAIKFIIFVVLFLSIGGFIVMQLWNSLIPLLFHGPELTFWQTIGLLILCKILFGGFGRSRWKGRDDKGWRGMRYEKRCDEWKEKMKDKMEGMSEEDREKFKEKFGKKFNFTVNL